MISLENHKKNGGNTEMQHDKFLISYRLIPAEKLIGLNPEQAVAMAEYINEMARGNAELYFMFSALEHGQLPEELKNDWPQKSDYHEVPAE